MEPLVDLNSITFDLVDLCTFSLFTVSSLLFGGFFATRFWPGNPIYTASISLFLGVAIWYTAASFAGFLGILNLGALWAFLGAATLLIVIAYFTMPVEFKTSNLTLTNLRLCPTDWALLALSLSFFPIAANAPHNWDDVMYHLPHARAWFIEGKLSVNTAFRYPLFPLSPSALTAWWMNFDTALISRLANILCFTAVTFLLYDQAKQRCGASLGFVAGFTWMLIVENEILGSGYVDVPLTAMVTGSIFFCLRYSEDRTLKNLIAAGFLIGSALSMKYQAVIFLMVPGLLLLIFSGGLMRGLLLSATVALVGGGWYLRAFLVSGDPVHPMGAEIFGFWLWNESDLEGQFANLSKVKGLPNPIFFVGLACVLFWRSLAKTEKIAVVTGWLWFLSWVAISGYPRYLVPAFPLLLWLGTLSLHHSNRALTDKGVDIFGRVRGLDATRIRAFYVGSIFVLSALTLANLHSSYSWLYFSEDRLHKEYKNRYPGYALASKHDLDLDSESRRIFLVSFGDEKFFLSPAAIGDHFGPNRIKDFSKAADDDKKLAVFLADHKVQYVLLRTEARWQMKLKQKLNRSEIVCLIDNSEKASLYKRCT